MRTNEELEIEIEYLRGVIGHLQDEAQLDFRHLKERIKALEKAESGRQAHEVTK